MRDYAFVKAGLFVALAIFATANCPAAPKFHAERPYPALGLKMRTLASADPSPLPPPQVFRCTSHGGDGEERVMELLSPQELWVRSQCAGRWVDKSGNELLIGKASALPLPEGIGSPVNFSSGEVRRLVTHEEFDAEMEKATEGFAGKEADVGAVREWVAAFTGVEVSEPEPINVRNSFNLAYVAFIPTQNPKTLAWLFRTKGGGGGAKPLFCAVVKIADGTSPQKVRKDFESQVLASVAPVGNANASNVKMGKNVFGDGANPSAPQESSPERDAALASIENMKGWWYADAKGYVILSDIRSAQGRRLVRWMQKNMPALRGKLEELVPPAGEKRELNVVRVFENRDSYRRYLSGDIEWSVGCWSPMRRELVINWIDDGGKAQETVGIIKHEGTHQYLFYALEQSHLSLWFNEGHACFMECADIDGQGKVSFRFKDSHYFMFLKQNLDSVTANIDFCVNADRDAFYAGSGQNRTLNYATAWALVWYLRIGLPADSPYSSILDVYREKVLETHDGAEATRAAFHDIDMDALKKAFHSYWKRK